MYKADAVAQLKVLRFPFIDYCNSPALAYEIVQCKGYKYLSVLTNGAINPNANYPSYQGSGGQERDLFIEFSRNEYHEINEEQFNIPIDGRDSFRLWFQAYSLATADFQGGYGDLIIILSEYPIPIWRPVKQSPYICFRITVPASTTQNYFLGENRSNASYTTLIPYIPEGYDYCNYSVVSSSTNFRVRAWYYPRCHTDIAITGLDTTVSTYGGDTIRGHNRARLELINNDASARLFGVMMVFMQRANDIN